MCELSGLAVQVLVEWRQRCADDNRCTHRGEQVAAERYYKEAIAVYDRGSRRATSSSGASSKQMEQVDREIPAVLFNYGQQLMHLRRYEEATAQLQRALKLANRSSLEKEHIAKIETMLFDISTAAAPAAEEDDVDDESD